MALTYEKSGVSIGRGDEVVRRLSSLLPALGGFGGHFPLDVSGFRHPVLVSGADGVGTKIQLSLKADKAEEIGIDLVAMNVNDILCSGAKPLFFLDYIASSHLDAEFIERMVQGMLQGCEQSGCRLLGGETAELPGVYKAGDYDIAGFSVGIVEEEKVLGPAKVKEGDVLLGLPSSGLHSNGYSLARSSPGEFLEEKIEGRTVLDLLTVPTRIYVAAVTRLLERYDIHAIAHITGGGLEGNLPRALPSELGYRMDRSAWKVPEIFRFLQEKGGIDSGEMAKAFNMGVGMVLILSSSDAEACLKDLKDQGEEAFRMGEVVRGRLES